MSETIEFSELQPQTEMRDGKPVFHTKHPVDDAIALNYFLMTSIHPDMLHMSLPSFVSVYENTMEEDLQNTMAYRINNEILRRVGNGMSSWIPAHRVFITDKNGKNEYIARVVIGPIDIPLGYHEYLESIVKYMNDDPKNPKPVTDEDVSITEWLRATLKALMNVARMGWHVNVERINVDPDNIEKIKKLRIDNGLDDHVDEWLFRAFIYSPDAIRRYNEMRATMKKEEFEKSGAATVMSYIKTETIVVHPDMSDDEINVMTEDIIDPSADATYVHDMETNTAEEPEGNAQPVPEATNEIPTNVPHPTSDDMMNSPD